MNTEQMHLVILMILVNLVLLVNLAILVNLSILMNLVILVNLMILDAFWIRSGSVQIWSGCGLDVVIFV